MFPAEDPNYGCTVIIQATGSCVSLFGWQIYREGDIITLCSWNCFIALRSNQESAGASLAFEDCGCG